MKSKRPSRLGDERVCARGTTPLRLLPESKTPPVMRRGGKPASLYSSTARNAMLFAMITVASPARTTRETLSPGGFEAHSTPACVRGSHHLPLSGSPCRRLLALFTAFHLLNSVFILATSGALVNAGARGAHMPMCGPNVDTIRFFGCSPTRRSLSSPPMKRISVGTPITP